MIYLDENKKIKDYKLVRRGQRYCVRVKGSLNTTCSWHWCRERNMPYRTIKQYWNTTWEQRYLNEVRDWDYDFIFDTKTQALTFIMGYL